MKKLIWVLPVLAIFTLPLRADTQEYVYVDGTYSGVSNGVAIGPYGGSLNGAPTQFFCVDYNSPIYGNTGWFAHVTDLTSPSGYAQTLLKSQTVYLEMAWLVTQMLNPANNQSTDAQLQWAIWYLSLNQSQQNSSFPDYQSDLQWDHRALAAVLSGFTVTGFEILTPAGSYGQEFLLELPGAATPEPSTLLLLSAGLLAVLVLSKRK